ncbi:MAG: hypothetical protein ACRCWQ_05975 [Bacilli bacterium]
MNKIKVLLFGYIDFNTMDGSAVFLSAIANVMALNPNIEIDVLLARPLHRDILIKNLYAFPNVRIINPFEEATFKRGEKKYKREKYMSYTEAAETIAYYWEINDYDFLMIRSMEVSTELKKYPDILKQSFIYVTGVTSEDQMLSIEEQSNLKELYDGSAYFLCQTKEMKKYIVGALNISDEKNTMIVLNPLIPNSEERPNFRRNDQLKLVYTGKFADGWNTLEMLVLTKYLRTELPELQLDVAGDKFGKDPNNPSFAVEAKYLLEHSEGVTWHGAVTREEARKLIEAADVGLTWRDCSMDCSLELSTKLLEYGILGKPVLLNPTKMHIDLYGEDYPLYVGNYQQFIDSIKAVSEDVTLYEHAAKRAYEVSSLFTFEQGVKLLTPYLFSKHIGALSNETIVLDAQFSESFVRHMNQWLAKTKQTSKVTYSENEHPTVTYASLFR